MNVSSWLIHTSIYSWTNTGASIDRKDEAVSKPSDILLRQRRNIFGLTFNATWYGRQTEENRDEEFLYNIFNK